MAPAFLIALCLLIITLAFAAWRRYLWAAEDDPRTQVDTSPDSLTDVFGQDHLTNTPHQKGIKWLNDVFSRSAGKFPDLTALQIPHSGESLTFAELDTEAERIAAALSSFLDGPDQVVAVAMSQDNWQIVASHLGVLKAGGTLVVLDLSLPDALFTHMLDDVQPVVVLTRGQSKFRDLPTIDVMALPAKMPRREMPTWLDDPEQRLATIFYTSGTTGIPKGVECPHAGYVNLALTYADYLDLIPGMDATSLTSSLGYDGSISEMYSAWVSGCAVVMLTKEQLRSGPDLVGVLTAAEVTVLFCPPVLLTTLTASPEVDLPYPLCRYIVPAGEPFPSALVEPWTRGRRQILNTYGPTEASTDTSRHSLRPEESVTIGSPFPNVTYVVLEVGKLDALPHGEVGELCIGGVHVARGYRNLPEETDRKFITHPKFGRLYRTGDKCRIDIQTQHVHFLGRIDTQLKVRGHRVESDAVEDVLQSQFSEIEAAVLDYQSDTLIAFVTAPSVAKRKNFQVSQAPVDWTSRVKEKLATRLPPPSVPTKIFLVEEFAMNPVSGKIDRKRLPNLTHLLSDALPDTAEAGEDMPWVAPQNGKGGVPPPVDDSVIEPECEEVLEICRTVLNTRLGLDDVFTEAGGHSISIANLAGRLQDAGWIVPVRSLLTDCNTARKVAGRPRNLQQTSNEPRVQTGFEERSNGRDEKRAKILPIGYFTTLQVLFACILYSPPLLVLLGIFESVEIGNFFTSANLGEFILVGTVLYLLGLVLPFATLFWVMLLKLCIGGGIYRNNVTAGTYPKWSKMHLRIWCIGRMQDIVLLTLQKMYRSARLTAFALRQLGASTGRNLQCAQEARFSGPLDLLGIEDEVAIQTGAYINTIRWSEQHIHVGPVHLESGCKIGMRAAIAPNVTIGRGTWITPLTPILRDTGSKQMWEGAPARLVGRVTALNRTASVCQYKYPLWWLEMLNVLMQVCASWTLSLVPTAAIFWFSRDLIFSGRPDFDSAYFISTPWTDVIWQLVLFAFITMWVSVVVTSALSCLFIRWTATAPGLYPSRSFSGALLMYRVNMLNAIQNQWSWTIIGQYLRALAGLRFSRLGASECDLMVNLVPELANADSKVFWSNGCFTNMLDYGAEHFKLRQLDMPRNFFCGNNCVAEHGHFPNNFLLGVSTPASDVRFRRRMWSRLAAPITVAGNPPVRFAQAPLSEEDQTQRLPNFPLFLIRVLLNDVLSIGFLRIAELITFTVFYIYLTRLGGYEGVNVLGALLATELSLILFSVALKKSLVGKEWGADHTTPFWSLKHFAYFFAQDCFFVWCKRSLGFFSGTIISNPILRWMGCQIGNRTIVNQPLQCADWNAVNIGSDCVMDGILQLHTFEDMILRVKRAQIRDGCIVGIGATVMGGAMIDQDSTLMPLSLVLKEMKLPTGTYQGSPVEPVSESTPPLPQHHSSNVSLEAQIQTPVVNN